MMPVALILAATSWIGLAILIVRAAFVFQPSAFSV
jgi:hypothetical protein